MSKNVTNELVGVTEVYILISLQVILLTTCFGIQVDTTHNYQRRSEFNLSLKLETKE
jgi:hypothetical protein